ncbi:hypothetical protein ABFA07_005257 [Porites harrisoni]
MGAHSRTNDMKFGTEQDFSVEEVIIHPNYRVPKFESNDFALLKLSKPAKLNKAVGLACIPDLGLPLPIDNPNVKCWTTGWGRLSEGGLKPTYLQQVAVPLVSQKQCAKIYRSSIDSSMLCAGVVEGGKDACQGDSGGPLVCEFNGRWYLEGATSFGVGCALPDFVGVYAKVRHFLHWMTKVTAGEVTTSNTHEKFICQDKKEVINCSGRKIRVVSAYYGRTKIFKCGMGLTTNCKASGSGSMIMKACNGKGSCVLYASNDVYGNPCPVYASKYIYIKYKCE